MKLAANFVVSELVHPDIIKKLGKTRAANLVSDYLIIELQKLRDQYGEIHVNGNGFKDSGIRTASYYKNWLGQLRQSYSTHQWGNTADLKFTGGIKPFEVYSYILTHQDKFPYIVRMENAYKTNTWLHIECGKYREKKIEVFNP